MSGDLIERAVAVWSSDKQKHVMLPGLGAKTCGAIAAEISRLQQQLSDCKSSLRAAEAELDEAMAEVERWNDDFVNRVVAEHGTTITILAARLDEYAERIRTAEAELNEARAAHKKSTHEAVRRLQALGRDKSGVETQLLAAEFREKQVRAALEEIAALEPGTQEWIDKIAISDGDRLAGNAFLIARRSLASKEGGE